MKTSLYTVGLLVLLVLLPLLGATLAGHDLSRYTEFPPVSQYGVHAPFSWPVFIGLTGLILVALLPFVVRIVRANLGFKPLPAPRRSFPWWGWLGLAAGALAWFLAWTRYAWFARYQAFTFTPLWLAYIVTVNALTQWRTGRCSLTRQPGLVAVLFGVSAGFWWFFEYLNRFVQNWAYEHVDGFSPMAYFLFATLPFATVLPAVLGTVELLQSFARLSAGTERFLAIRPRHPRRLAAVAILLAVAGLMGLPAWPDTLFPLLWVAPLVLITGLQALRGRPTIFSPLRSGDWRNLVLWALAALVCGFFWELWNIRSLARWVYLIPFVQRFHVFEMPLLGYSGYLTFGLECAVICEAVARWRASRAAPASRKRRPGNPTSAVRGRSDA